MGLVPLGLFFYLVLIGVIPTNPTTSPGIFRQHTNVSPSIPYFLVPSIPKTTDLLRD